MTPSRNVRALITLAIFCVLLFELGVLMAGFRRSLDGNGDFSAFYRTGVMVRAGELHSLYDPNKQLQFDQRLFPELHRFPAYYFYHPPVEALVLTVLASFSYRTAFWIWSAISLALLVLSGTILSRQFPRLRDLCPLPLSMVLLTFFPVVMVFLQGQDSALLLLLATLAFVEACRGRQISCGILLGLALFKFQFILPTAAILAFQMGRKFVLAFAATALALLGSCWALVGTAGLRNYWQMVEQGTPEMTWRMPNIRGAVESLGGPPLVAVILGLGLCAWCAFRVGRLGTSGFGLAIVCSLLASYHGHVYDCVLLIIPVFCAMEEALRKSSHEFGLWPALFFVMLPVYVLLTRWHATWLFAGLFLLLAATIAFPLTKLNCFPARAGATLS